MIKFIFSLILSLLTIFLIVNFSSAGCLIDPCGKSGDASNSFVQEYIPPPLPRPAIIETLD